MITALPMDDQREGIAHHIDDNLSDQQANYLLARFNARTDAVPRARDLCRVQAGVAILQTERDWRPYVVLSKLLLQRANRGQSIVPTPFQLASNQPVVRIDFVILPMRADGLEPACSSAFSSCASSPSPLPMGIMRPRQPRHQVVAVDIEPLGRRRDQSECPRTRCNCWHPSGRRRRGRRSAALGRLCRCS